MGIAIVVELAFKVCVRTCAWLSFHLVLGQRLSHVAHAVAFAAPEPCLAAEEARFFTLLTWAPLFKVVALLVFGIKHTRAVQHASEIQEDSSRAPL